MAKTVEWRLGIRDGDWGLKVNAVQSGEWNDVWVQKFDALSWEERIVGELLEKNGQEA
jgi:hypothetical protein